MKNVGFAVLLLALAAPLGAQTPSQPPAQTPAPAGRGTAPRPAAAAPRAQSVRVAVRDQDGSALANVHLVLSGDATGEYTTGAAGTAIIPNLKAGSYRVRCELDGFITLEREFALRNGAWNPVDITLSAAPKKAPEPAKAPPRPEPAPTPVPPSGPPVLMSLPDYLDHNLIGGREPIKESILACNPLETVRLLQMRDAVAPHVHDRADEVIYVVAGEGAVKIGEQTTVVKAGTLVVVPNGASHAFERRGKNPMIVVSTLAGMPCEAPKSTP